MKQKFINNSGELFSVTQEEEDDEEYDDDFSDSMIHFRDNNTSSLGQSSLA